MSNGMTKKVNHGALRGWQPCLADRLRRKRAISQRAYRFAEFGQLSDLATRFPDVSRGGEAPGSSGKLTFSGSKRTKISYPIVPRWIGASRMWKSRRFVCARGAIPARFGRMRTANKFVANYAIGTDCGLGRRRPETIPAHLRIHREASEAA
jgi:hypothetical protein